MERLRVHTRDQTQDHTHCSLLIDKCDHPIGRVAAGEKVPSLEKGLSRLRNGNKKGDPQMVSKIFLPYHPGRRGGLT